MRTEQSPITNRPSVPLASSLDVIQPSAIREIANVAFAMDDVLALHFGESTMPTPPYIAAALAITSSDSSRPEIWLVPRASPPNRTARCDIDLSPGTRHWPVSAALACARQGSCPYLSVIMKTCLVARRRNRISS